MTRPLRVLLVNDDGPPSPTSPYVLALYEALVELGWTVRAVLPSGQRSWSGTNYSVSEPQVRYWYYYPISGNNDGSNPGTDGSWSDTRRQIDRARGEIGEWVLVDATPSSCTNIGIYAQETLFGETDAFDLVISGPNLGRNTGTAFCLSSGTVGAAMAGALCHTKAIAVSYGHFAKDPPSVTPGRTDPLSKEELQVARNRALAHTVALIKRLWREWDAHTALYSINVPLCDTLARPEVCWTRLWPSSHGQIYCAQTDASSAASTPGLFLDFKPQLGPAMRPSTDEELEPGTDVWAVCTGKISVTPLKTSFEHPTALPETPLSVASVL
ncbi:hypothetical protein MCUN1_002524 [Malassezia cuniculi]|uniref:Survival protein SurE-like phosphatase/nucleotidase domain-containing protein n=1 Tax=Malassezia cuniculi TaxID=948313 RepID=A0AAF0EZV9_9BASI|nr:hypothetical protein MCUN1_002524 [Malassezia cuniculi]